MKGSASEPKEVYNWIPFRKKYFLMNPYFKYFNSYSRKDLPGKAWEVWGDVKLIEKKKKNNKYIRLYKIIVKKYLLSSKKNIYYLVKKVFTK